jgi:hypothetical protein
MSKYAPDSPPDDRVSPCDVCGGDPFGCECPECTECGGAGDPRCFVNGGRGCQLFRGSERFAAPVDAVLPAVRENSPGDVAVTIEKPRDAPVPTVDYWHERCGICMKSYDDCDCAAAGRR